MRQSVRLNPIINIIIIINKYSCLLLTNLVEPMPPKRKTRAQKVDEPQSDVPEVTATEAAPKKRGRPRKADTAPQPAPDQPKESLYPVIPELQAKEKDKKSTEAVENDNENKDTNNSKPDSAKEPAKGPKETAKKGRKKKPWQKDAEEVNDNVNESTDDKSAANGKNDANTPTAGQEGQVGSEVDSLIEAQAESQALGAKAQSSKRPASALENDSPLINPKKRARPSGATVDQSPAKRQKLPSSIPRPQAQLRSHLNDSPSKPVQNPAKYKELEAKFNQLRNLRETQAEEALRKYKEVSERRNAASEQLIKELTLKLAQKDAEESKKADQPAPDAAQQEQSSEQIQNLQEEIEELDVQLESLQHENQQLQAKLEANSLDDDLITASRDFTSTISGLVISDVYDEEDDSRRYECVHSGLNGSFRYSLIDDGENIAYIPQFEDKDATIAELLPPYMCESLSFAKDSVSCCVYYYSIMVS
uniref:ARAD1A08140p n=1 Tax=Blastobotrys adeninivorans TaxID=409370 RepID=A0A060T2G3_BLAAD